MHTKGGSYNERQNGLRIEQLRPCIIAGLTGWKAVNQVHAQSTSSILDASSAAPSTYSSGGRPPSSPKPSSSSSMLRPSLIIRWIRPANWVGSSKLKPDVSSEVSKSSQIRSLTVLSDLSAAAFFLSSVMIEGLGLTSMVFFETM